MPLIDHPAGHYRFLPGISPYSGGVVSAPGYEVVHATLHRPLPYKRGFELIERQLGAAGQPKAALCGVELRCPAPYSFEGFATFNRGYAQILETWGVFVAGVNPVARTNVAPELDPPDEPLLYGFSYTRSCDASLPATFVVAGGGELPEGVLAAEGIILGGQTGPQAIAGKAAFVMDLMEARLHGLGARWEQVTVLDIYTVHSIHHLLSDVILKRARPAGAHGVRWFYSRPPIEGIEFEMDLRGVRSEIRLE